MDEPKPMRELTRIREERGLSQQGLADASGVNKATINQIERGRRSPNLETLEKLADALAVEMGDFFPKAEAPLPDFEDERRASLRSWVDFAGRLADRWAGEIEEREGRSSTASSAVKKHVMMLPNLHWALEVMGTYTDVVEALATDPNYAAGVYGREEVRELYAAAERMKEAVDRTKDWFLSGQEDPKMAEVIDLRRVAIERAEKRLGTRAS